METRDRSISSCELLFHSHLFRDRFHSPTTHYGKITCCPLNKLFRGQHNCTPQFYSSWTLNTGNLQPEKERHINTSVVLHVSSLSSKLGTALLTWERLYYSPFA
jgi:hypothetical protein